MRVQLTQKKADYFSAFSGWIENLGVDPLLLLRAFLLFPILDFLLALLFLVTRVLETIFKLLNVSHKYPKNCWVAHWATRCPRHNFINLQVLQSPPFLVKDILLPLTFIFQTHSVTASKPTNFQELNDQKQNKESSQRTKEDITLAKGELFRLPLAGLKRFSVGNKEVLKARALGTSTLLLKGEKIGHSDLLIWENSSQMPSKLSVFVVRKSHQLKVMQLAHSLSSLGLSTSRQGTLITLSGSLSSLQNYRRFVKRIGDNKENLNLDNVTLDADLRKKVFSNFLVQVSRFGLEEINCHPLKLYIRCEAAKELQGKLRDLNKSFLIDWVSDGLLQATRQYKVTLILQQFENSSGRAFNFGLSQIEGPLSSLIFQNPLALIENNSLILKSDKFRSQTLAHPVIKGRLDFPIKVRIGQQIPFLQSVSNGVATQQWRFAGLSIDLILTAFSKRLKVKYKTNLSRPRGSGISQNLQESLLLIPIGETVVLFDIGFRVNQEDISQLPILSQIPLFGSLFTGETFHKSYKKVLCLIKIEEI